MLDFEVSVANKRFIHLKTLSRAYYPIFFVDILKLFCFVFMIRIFAIENRIYREEFNVKKSKAAILLYCFHTAGVPYIFMLYNLLGPGISFYRKSKINVKRKPNYELAGFIIDQ